MTGFADAGFYRFSADVRNEVTAPTITEVFKEFEAMRSQGAEGAELDGAKSYLRGIFAVQTSTQNGLAGTLNNVYVFGLPKDYPETFRAKIAAVSVRHRQVTEDFWVAGKKLRGVFKGAQSARRLAGLFVEKSQIEVGACQARRALNGALKQALGFSESLLFGADDAQEVERLRLSGVAFQYGLQCRLGFAEIMSFQVAHDLLELNGIGGALGLCGNRP